jgi:phospholipase B1
MTSKFKECREIFEKKFPITCICNSEKVVGIARKRKTDELAYAYNLKLAEIAVDYQMKNYDDFTVVYDPSLGYANVTQGTRDMISGVDCFHPSIKAHNLAGAKLWSNMFKPQNEKEPVILSDPFLVDCPDGNNFILIVENSRFWSS